MCKNDVDWKLLYPSTAVTRQDELNFVSLLVGDVCVKYNWRSINRKLYIWSDLSF
jgi:hypothetical protein